MKDTTYVLNIIETDEEGNKTTRLATADEFALMVQGYLNGRIGMEGISKEFVSAVRDIVTTKKDKVTIH